MLGTMKNVEHFGAVLFNPFDTGLLLLFSRSVFVFNITEEQVNRFLGYIRYDTIKQLARLFHN